MSLDARRIFGKRRARKRAADFGDNPHRRRGRDAATVNQNEYWEVYYAKKKKSGKVSKSRRAEINKKYKELTDKQEKIADELYSLGCSAHRGKSGALVWHIPTKKYPDIRRYGTKRIKRRKRPNAQEREKAKRLIREYYRLRSEKRKISSGLIN